MRHPDNLDEGERMDLEALRQVHPALEMAHSLMQDSLQMLRKREGERLDAWLTQVQESGLPELANFAHGVEQDQAAVQAGLTLPINNGQTEGHVTRIKLIKRMMYGKAGLARLAPTRVSPHLENAPNRNLYCSPLARAFQLQCMHLTRHTAQCIHSTSQREAADLLLIDVQEDVTRLDLHIILGSVATRCYLQDTIGAIYLRQQSESNQVHVVGSGWGVLLQVCCLPGVVDFDAKTPEHIATERANDWTCHPWRHTLLKHARISGDDTDIGKLIWSPCALCQAHHALLCI